jgi:hypothetical protein
MQQLFYHIKEEVKISYQCIDDQCDVRNHMGYGEIRRHCFRHIKIDYKQYKLLSKVDTSVWNKYYRQVSCELTSMNVDYVPKQLQNLHYKEPPKESPDKKRKLYDLDREHTVVAVSATTPI